MYDTMSAIRDGIPDPFHSRHEAFSNKEFDRSEIVEVGAEDREVCKSWHALKG
jgi:hypothetical protein